MRNLSPRLRKANDVRHGAEESLYGGLKRPFLDAEKREPGFRWRLQDIGDAKAMGCLWSRASWRERNETKRGKGAAISRAGRSGRSEKPFDIRQGAAGFGVCPALAQHFLAMLPFLPFRMAMYIPCCCT